MKKLIAISIALQISLTCFSQQTNDWQTVYIKGVGQIKLPPTLEVQAGSYKSLNKILYDAFGIEYTSDDLVFQQKGLNSYDSTAYKTYVRVMISTQHSKEGTYATPEEKMNFGPQDLADINNTYKEVAKNSLPSNTKLLTWLDLKETTLNKMHCLTYSYQRQITDKPIVKVTCYLFQNNDKIHTLTISYRPSETEQWETTLNLMKSTFKID